MFKNFKHHPKIIPFLLAVFMLISTLPLSASAATQFPDAKGWSAPCIERLESEGVLAGYPDGTVKPGKNVTQAEYAALLTRKAGMEPVTVEGSWDAKYSGALSQAGVIAANEDYNANASITRMELIAWTIRALGGEELADRERETLSFPDSGERTDEEKGYLAVSADSGLIVGFPDGNAHPDNPCSRGEAFAILCRYDAAKSYVEQALEPKPVYIPSVSVPTPPQPVIPEGEPITITAPEKVTATDPWEVSVTLRSDVAEAAWEMPNASYEGALDTQGGTLTFSQAGEYTLTLSGKDAKGDPVSKNVTVTVEELPPIRIFAPDSAMVNQPWTATVKCAAGLSDGCMSVEREGGDGGYDGWLENDGGALTFFAPGTYTVTLSGRDDNGESVSGSITVEVIGNPIRQIASPSFTIPQQVYVDTDCAITLDNDPAEGVTVSWAVQPEGYTGELSSSGGTLQFSTSGEYTMTATACDASGNESVSFQTITVKERPEIRMEPFRWRSPLEYETSTRILHVDDVFSDYPSRYHTEDMTSTFSLLTADGEPVEAAVANFTDRDGLAYQFVPKVEGDYLVKATLTDATGTSFEFFAKFKIVPNVYAEITGVSRTALVDQKLTGEVVRHNMSKEHVDWALSYLSDEIAAQEIPLYGENGLADCARGWEFKSLDEDATFDLTENGFTISFHKAGYYAIITNVTDQYGKIESCYAMVHIVAES